MQGLVNIRSPVTNMFCGSQSRDSAVDPKVAMGKIPTEAVYSRVVERWYSSVLCGAKAFEYDLSSVQDESVAIR